MIQRLLDAHLRHVIGEKADLRGREDLEMKLGVDLLDALDHFEIVVEGEIGMEAAHHVELGAAPAQRLRHLEDFLQRIRIGVLLAFFLAERAELARLPQHADVRVVDVAVHVVVGAVPVQALSGDVRQVADGVDVLGFIEAHALLESEAQPRFDFFENIAQRAALDARAHEVPAHGSPSVFRLIGESIHSVTHERILAAGWRYVNAEEGYAQSPFAS